MKYFTFCLLLLASFCATSGTITINGKTYTGNNVIVNNGVHGSIIIDGNNVVVGDSTEINIQVTGNINSLKVTSCHTCIVNGSVGTVESTSGDVQVGNVSGNVTTVSGDVHAHQIGGDVRTVSGDINR